MSSTHVVAVSGSLRETSYTRYGLRWALRGVEDVGATGELLDLREFDLPPFDPDVDSQGDGDRLTRRVRAADSVILGTPMYHGSYSGVLKNALDYCGFDEFEHTTVGLLVVSGGSFPTPALEHLRSVCRSLNSWVLPHQAAIPNASQQFEDGELVEERLAERVHVLGQRVVQFANIEPEPATIESEENVGA